jgi:hypothetical protein
MRKLSISLLTLAAVLVTTPALAHDEDHHGLPGAMHGFSAEHFIWPGAVALAILLVLAIRRPLLKLIARWTRDR